MNLRLSVSIVGVPERLGKIRSTLMRLRLSERCVALDHEHRGPGWNAHRAWELYDRTASHHLVMLDDMKSPPDLVRRAEEALVHVPDQAVSLFSCRWSYMEEAREKGLSWTIPSPPFLNATATILPVAWIPDWLAWDASGEPERVLEPVDWKHDDTRMAAWLKATGRKMWCTVPCLVENDGIGISEMGHSGKVGGRPLMAGEFYVGDAGERWPSVDWSKTPKKK